MGLKLHAPILFNGFQTSFRTYPMQEGRNFLFGGVDVDEMVNILDNMPTNGAAQLSVIYD